MEYNKYQNAKIYKIEPTCEHEPNEVYYGSTTKELNQRYIEHKCAYTQWKNKKYAHSTVFDLFDKYTVNNCNIDLLEMYPCNTNKELTSREGYYILNNPHINKKVNGLSKQDSYKLWRSKNLESESKRFKKFYDANKEYNLNRRKEYYKQNKDEICRKIKCLCGGCYTSNHKKVHYKTTKHQQYETTKIIKHINETFEIVEQLTKALDDDNIAELKRLNECLTMGFEDRRL
jgi:hypothetical protein